jgi:LysR family transcriptional regulator, glycine cleavage system transcriptional activator
VARLFYDLPGLTALAAFEAAARHESLKRAAVELNVTPGAVSHQIRALEEDLGLPLFRRVHRGVELTAEGRELHDALSNAFGRISSAIEQLRGQGRGGAVSVGATSAVASLWLMPRISGFWRSHPDVRIVYRISDERFDPRRDDTQLVVRYGSGEWPDQESAMLFQDTLAPVCSPEFAARHADVAVEDLPRLPLVRLSAPDRAWTTWPEFLAAFSVPSSRVEGPSFTSYMVALQAAQDGAGVALGWTRLLRPVLERGDLVPLTDARMPSSGAFHLTWSRRRPLPPAAAVLRDWLAAPLDEFSSCRAEANPD